MRFASTAARDSALSAVKTNGMHAYTTDASRLWQYDGTDWVIMSEPTQGFTPTWTGLTTTSGTNTGYYRRRDGYCDFKITFTFGASSAVTGAVTVALPIAANIAADLDGFDVFLYDASAVTFYTGATSNSTSSIANVVALNSAGTYVTAAALSSTVPFTWATSDVLSIRGTYRMTTRYS
jgi:hypothetical protein